MESFLGCAGALWVLFGIGYLLGAKSAIHEIAACLSMSFGVSFWAWAAILGRLRAWHRDWKATQSAGAGAPPVATGGGGADVPIDRAIQGVRAGPSGWRT